MVEVRLAYPLALARHLKCPIDSRYTGSAESAIQVQPVLGSVGLEGGVGNRGPTGPRRPWGPYAVPVVVEEPSPTPSPTP